MKQSLTRVARMAMGVLALAMAASCSSDKADEPIVNPDNSDGTAVKAQLAINIGTTSASTGSRQTDDIVQASGQAFRGIQDIYLLPVLSTFATSGTVNSTFTFSDWQIFQIEQILEELIHLVVVMLHRQLCIMTLLFQ